MTFLLKFDVEPDIRDLAWVRYCFNREDEEEWLKEQDPIDLVQRFFKIGLHLLLDRRHKSILKVSNREEFAYMLNHDHSFSEKCPGEYAKLVVVTTYHTAFYYHTKRTTWLTHTREELAKRLIKEYRS